MGSIVESVLSSILAGSHEGVIVCRPDGVVESWNPSAERLLGYSATEAIGEQLAKFFPSDVDGKATSGEGIHKSGERVPLAITRSTIRGADNAIVSEVTIVHGLVANGPSDWDAERLNLAHAAARLGEWSWDAKTDVVALSPRAAELFGIPAGPHMTWTAMRDILHLDDRERARIAVEQAIADRGNYAIEYRVMNGAHKRYIAASGRGRYSERGEVLGMLGVVQDISSDRLLVHVDDAVRPLVEPDDITYTAARVLGEYLNVDRCAYAFVEPDEDTFTLTGNYTHGVESIVGRYRFRQFGAECLRLMRAGQPYVVSDIETDPRVDDDDRRAYALTTIRAVVCVPIMKADRFVAAMAVHMRTARQWSATEVKLVEQVASRCWESIERSKVEHERGALLEAAEAANRAKDEFLAMLGHELRNPLAPILTAVQLMKLRNDVASERERNVIERQVVHLTRLVDDLLDVSRIAGGKVLLKSELVEIAEVVADAIEVASPLLDARSQTLVLEVQPAGMLVNGDADRLTQIISNLLTNASKYTPTAGRITVSAGLEDDEVVLRVQDTGIGIAADALPHIFDLFVQGGQTIDRAQGGLGLGLTIVKSLVERHGGRVTAHSEGADQGTVVVVRLPQAHRAPESAEVKAASSLTSASTAKIGTRVLIVDDNEDAATLLSSALTLHGCETHVAHDGPEALRVGATQPFDAALLDIGLPVMDGYELATRLRDLPTFHNAVLIAVTGYGQSSDHQRSLAAGFQHHLVKPVDLEALITKLPVRSAPGI